MEIVILTALGVGGATVLGAAIGMIFRHTSRRFCDGATSFAAGVMLAAAVVGLILPSLKYGGRLSVLSAVVGIFIGAVCLDMFDRLVLRRWAWSISDVGDDGMRRVVLFVTAIAIHNLPEGIAAGVGFGNQDVSRGLFIATAIALQNVPEGMAVIVAMLGVGIRPRRTFLIAALTGVVEIFGTFIGYFAVNISAAVLPFALAFAGGNMLYVIADEMIPEVHSGGDGRSATYLILAGFCLMLIINELL